ncbi:MAG TPA: Ku protein, partial [Polyangiaceae bacterium]|nr:Ku protein [Polyangiaceae bacterium]
MQIPVRLLGAERSQELSFHQLDRRDQARIRYERINEQTGEKVAWDDIVKGFEVDDGSVVVMEDKDFENAAAETTHTIDISDFVDGREISPSFFERPYFVAPDRGGDKPYALIRDVLEKTGLMAIGLVVIRTRQHLCAIFPQGKGLVLEILRFADELAPLKSVSGSFPGDVKASAKEIALAEQLVESLRGKWDPAQYR